MIDPRCLLIAILAVSACAKSADREPAAQHAPTPKPTTATPAAELGTLAPGTGLAVGEHVPDVQALDLDGKPTRLADLVAKGPLLLVFYRGGWCPYCNYEIHEMTAAYPEYQKRGVLPVAVSVDVPEEGAKTSATYTIPFPVLSDSRLAFINAFHVANHVDDAMLAKLKGFGVDLEKSSGQPHHTIAIPALFLIDKQGVIRWAHDDPTITVRPSTAQILAAIDATHVGSTP
ncbi:MAG TPA: peroxiredoxin family protein [Kofleriaceae bacterium]|jgi:peroxiredoxin